MKKMEEEKNKPIPSPFMQPKEGIDFEKAITIDLTPGGVKKGLDELKNLILEKASKSKKDGKVIKTLPVNPEWIKTKDNLLIEAKKLELQMGVIDSKVELLWKELRFELGITENHIEYNPKTKEIDVYDN